MPRLARRTLGHMVSPSAGLMASPPVRPLQPRAPPGVLGLAQEEQQPSHLGERQRDPVGRVAPPFPSLACVSRALRRVTSRAAWASSARVT
jgi:hypothetical protein